MDMCLPLFPARLPSHAVINVASYCAGGNDNVNVNARAVAVAGQGVAEVGGRPDGVWPQALTLATASPPPRP